MNNKEFIAELAQRTGYTQADTQKLVNALIEGIGNRFGIGENIVMTGFGTFEIKKRLERIIVSPSTGQRMLVPPKLVLGFKPVMTLKERLKSGEEGND